MKVYIVSDSYELSIEAIFTKRKYALAYIRSEVKRLNKITMGGYSRQDYIIIEKTITE